MKPYPFRVAATVRSRAECSSGDNRFGHSTPPSCDLTVAATPSTYMKPVFILALAGALLSGCATSTIESRKKERYNAYTELSAEQRSAVDAGQIKVGMPKDAVYIAWGKPHQVLVSESSA